MKPSALKDPKPHKNTTHGLCWHPLYVVWHDIKVRCGVSRGANTQKRKDYINRGITVCIEWHNFIPFYNWAKDKWEKGLTIDRINNNGNYAPDNCRFITRKINNQNSTQSKRWFVDGKQFNSLRDAARALGVDPMTIHRWCRGKNRNGKFYPPKKDCYSIKLY